MGRKEKEKQVYAFTLNCISCRFSNNDWGNIEQ